MRRQSFSIRRFSGGRFGSSRSSSASSSIMSSASAQDLKKSTSTSVDLPCIDPEAIDQRRQSFARSRQRWFTAFYDLIQIEQLADPRPIH